MRATKALAATAAALMTAMICSSCGNGSSTPSSEPASARPTQTIEVDEPHANASLDDLGQASDLVFRARVTKVATGLALGSDTSIAYKAYTIKSTSKDGRTAQVYVSETVDGVPIAVENRAELGVGDEALWALTPLDPGFGAEGFVLTSSSSIFPVVDGKLKVTSSSPAGKEAATLQPAEALRRLGAR